MTEMMVCFSQCMLSEGTWCEFITIDVDLYHLVKMVSVRFLSNKLINTLDWNINKY